MQMLRTKTALIVGVIALLIGIGAGVIAASMSTGKALAQGSSDEFDGIIEALPGAGVIGDWQVSGRRVIVNEQTDVDREGQTLAPGLRVEIEGTYQPDGSILAEEIEVKDADDDDDGSSADADDDDGPSAPTTVPAYGDDDDDDGGPSTPNYVPSGGKHDDDD